MTNAQVVETSIVVHDNSYFQNYTKLDDNTCTLHRHLTHAVKDPDSILRGRGCGVNKGVFYLSGFTFVARKEGGGEGQGLSGPLIKSATVRYPWVQYIYNANNNLVKSIYNMQTVINSLVS